MTCYCSTKCVHSAILPVALTNGNKGQGNHWGGTAKARKAIEEDLRVLGFAKSEPFDHKCYVVITRILGPNQKKYDPDSIGRGNAKQIMDSLVALNWFHDDRAGWIADVDYRQIDNRRDEGPATVVDVYEVKE